MQTVKHTVDIQEQEMEFLVINLRKDSSLLLHAIRSPIYWRIFKKSILFSVCKNPFKKIREKIKLESIHG
jgi:hypothetical protein